MEEKTTEYIVIEFIDDVEEAISQAKKHELSANLIKGLETLHGDLVTVGNLANTDERVQRLKADVEKILEDLVNSCKAGDDGKSLGSMRQLRDKIHTLKAIWDKEK
jgi:hypothetical protein